MLIDKSKLIIRPLNFEELDAYLSFKRYVRDNMEHPEWLGVIPKDAYEFMLQNNSEIYVWTFEENKDKKLENIDQFVACGMIIPSRQKDLDKFLQSDLNFEEVVDFGPEMVTPKYVGNGLQCDVIHFLENRAVEKGYKYGIGTVHPDNVFSIRNLIKCDFEDVARVDLSRGTRDVLRKQF